MIRGVVFDFDGLILDTETPDYQAWQELFREYGADLPLASWLLAVGTSSDVFNPYDYLEEQIGHPVDRAAVRLDHRRRHTELITGVPPLPGVLDYIHDARRLGLKLGVASSSSQDWVAGHLARLGLKDYFETIRSGDQVEKVKPDPELYRLAVVDLDIEADEALALEDSLNGALAAKRAGLFCVAVPNAVTQHLSFDIADLKLSSLADLSLEELLQRLLVRSKESSTAGQ